MAQIVINEISDNYTYNIGRNSFATVALPITAMWGPAFLNPDSTDGGIDTQLEETEWKHFPATQAGLESFVATYRGPSSNYKLTKDLSYQMAMTLLTAGYDVLVCRLCPGTNAECLFGFDDDKEFIIKAKYPGSFGNNLKVALSKVTRGSVSYWNLVTYVVDISGIQTAVENLAFVFDIENSTDSLPHIDEVESNFLTFVSHDGIKDNSALSESEYRLLTEEPADWSNATSLNYYMYDTSSGSGGFYRPLDGGVSWKPNMFYEKLDISVDSNNVFSCMLKDGSDTLDISGDTSAAYIEETKKLVKQRYTSKTSVAGGISLGAGYDSDDCDYLTTINDLSIDDIAEAKSIANREWLFTYAYVVYQLLKDKLNYNPQRIISPGWDDQDYDSLGKEPLGGKISKISPFHKIIMETAYYSRCATGMLDIPRSCPRSVVYDASAETPGYAQMLSRIDVSTGGNDVNAILYSTHSALFAPWGQYKYVGTGKQNIASPSFLALMIQRAQILNQPLQYEWALPTNRKHNLKLGKFDYKVPKKLLDVWQKLEGVGVNVLTEIPELGVNLWGNSTLYEVPPATYQALANLSTRYLVNAVEDIAYKCGISITFQYNNEQAYNKFYAGVTPTLDTMKNVGAIDDYYVKMAADINGLDQVNANTVIGKIYLVINGVINDIIIDLIALPPGTDLNQYKS